MYIKHVLSQLFYNCGKFVIAPVVVCGGVREFGGNVVAARLGAKANQGVTFMLQIKNIKKDYPVASDLTVHALKGVSVSFRESEFVSILGPSGCGKTTLLNIIGGLDRYTSGDLVINGVSTKNYRDSDWDTYRNHSIGFVFQSYNLIPHMNILDNVTLSLTLAGASKAERIAKAKVALERVGLAKQMKKRPNQLSGGQMQRVAIARAIVNDPDIILADEPTGALDSETSVQIMDILKEIAEERLVVMVTHNRELAERYSTRIVSLLDGEIVSDTNPFDGEQSTVTSSEATPAAQDATDTQASVQCDSNAPLTTQSGKSKGKKRSKMSLWTAFVLSFRNLLSKKGRTLLTSFAGSIGIFGVTLVLAISAGMTAYVDNVQRQAMGDTPITVSTRAVDFESMMSGESFTNKLDPYPSGTTAVKPYKPAMISYIENNITEEYVAYVKNMDETLYKTLDFTYNLSVNAFVIGSDGNYTHLSRFASNATGMVSSQEMFADNYDVLYKTDSTSGYPTEENEIALVVDKYNRMSTTLLTALGINAEVDGDNYKEIAYADLVGRTYKLVLNNAYYLPNEDGHYAAITSRADINAACESTNAITLRVTSIVRRKSDDSAKLAETGVLYSVALADRLLDDSLSSDVVKAQKENPDVNILTGKKFADAVGSSATYESVLKTLGGSNLPDKIDIFPQNASAKDKITAYLDEWNAAHESDPDAKVTYTDLQGVALSMMSTMIDVTTWVLVAFSAVSLIVSTVMIAVTTYTSVIERTKEIGVLRSLGARKKDISTIFNTETSIIGALAGVIGIVFAVIVGIIVNIVLHNLFNVTNIVLFTLPVVLGMFVLSIALTLVAGLIPASLAAKKDPVTCLRSE